MGKFDGIKATINANIKTNGKQEITGNVLNHVLNGMVSATEAQVVELSDAIKGISPAPMVSVTHAELVNLRNRGKLVPGMQYRITDYVTTTTQENTRSAGHQFDIIVTADNENTLSEVARACRSEFDIEKYKDAYSNAWGERMTYLGTYEYYGKIYHRYESESQDMQMLVDFREDVEDLSEGGEEHYRYRIIPSYLNNENNGWESEVGDDIVFTHNPAKDAYFFDSNLAAWQIWYILDNDAERFVWADTENGKGVIYRMIDEWGNDCPYDFKNIQFKRGIYADGGGIAKEEGDEDYEVFCYTFSWEDEEQVIMDASIFGNNGYLLNDEGQISGVYGNTIKSYITYTGEFESPSITQQFLNNIVFLSTFGYEEGVFYGCYGNSFGNSCYDNSFGNSCYDNSFGNGCYNNSFGNDCFGNSFGNSCYGNRFRNYCSTNLLESHCVDNNMRTNCHGITMGLGCSNNTLEDVDGGAIFLAQTYNFTLADNGKIVGMRDGEAVSFTLGDILG